MQDIKIANRNSSKSWQKSVSMRAYYTMIFFSEYKSQLHLSYTFSNLHLETAIDDVESTRNEFKRKHGLNDVSDSEFKIQFFNRLEVHGTTVNVGKRDQPYAKVKINQAWNFIKIFKMIRVGRDDKFSIYIKYKDIKVKRTWRKGCATNMEYCTRLSVEVEYENVNWMEINNSIGLYGVSSYSPQIDTAKKITSNEILLFDFNPSFSEVQNYS
ncbi:hypothetical protein C6P40_002033 [Pichia californica]|uniref:Uncharacterized protein n=1 Tax=Pichia californica TaxID=460514 RepID=A0A9P6WPD3_9ASCO|nr:hypothetical protein C6P42_004852 [[Candida] californica]KAG0690670.1 hypothetical protein C6P40_002033 [[Candida] californica]